MSSYPKFIDERILPFLNSEDAVNSAFENLCGRFSLPFHALIDEFRDLLGFGPATSLPSLAFNVEVVDTELGLFLHALYDTLRALGVDRVGAQGGVAVFLFAVFATAPLTDSSRAEAVMDAAYGVVRASEVFVDPEGVADKMRAFAALSWTGSPTAVDPALLLECLAELAETNMPDDRLEEALDCLLDMPPERIRDTLLQLFDIFLREPARYKYGHCLNWMATTDGLKHLVGDVDVPALAARVPYDTAMVAQLERWAEEHYRRRLEALGLFGAMWDTYRGVPPPPQGPATPLSQLTRALCLRRICRVRGDDPLGMLHESVEPFGRDTVLFL